MIRLGEIKTPVIEAALASGEVRIIDPFDCARRLEAIQEQQRASGKQPGYADSIATLRSVFGLGVDDATDYAVICLQQAVVEMVTKEIASKVEPPARQS